MGGKRKPKTTFDIKSLIHTTTTSPHHQENYYIQWDMMYDSCVSNKMLDCFWPIATHRSIAFFHRKRYF